MDNRQDLVEKLVDPHRCTVSCALMRLEAADEIVRLRLLVKAWKHAAESYEHGALGEGDRLVSEARNIH